MPRYALYRFDGPPAPQMPVGMNELIGIGRYTTQQHAEQRLLKLVPKGCKMFSTGEPATHLGLYVWPDRGEDKLVKEIPL